MTDPQPIAVTVTRRLEATPEQGLRCLARSPGRAILAVHGTGQRRSDRDRPAGRRGRFTVADRRGDEVVVHRGTYLEIERPRRLRFRFWVADQAEVVDGVTAEITPDGRGCTLTVTHELHPDWADYATPTRQAWEAMADRLAGDVGADAGKSLTITRLLDAPRALVFHMWAEPEHLSRWFGPKDFAIPSVTIDFRPGGAWMADIRSPTGQHHRMGGVYREIVPDERIVFTHAWMDAAGNPGLETVITVTFDDHGSGTKLTFHQAVFETASARNSHRKGWGEALDNLAAHVGAALDGEEAVREPS